MKNTKKFLGLDFSTKIKSGIDKLDSFLRGGFEPGLIHFYGMPGTGKSNLAMQVMIKAYHDGFSSIWIDCNGSSFDIRRVLELSSFDNKIFEKIMVLKPLYYKEFFSQVDKLGILLNVKTKLIVIDPITYYYRLNVNSRRWFKLHHELSEIILAKLIGFSVRNKLCVLLLNQITSRNDKIIAVCEDIIERHSKYSISFHNKKGRYLLLHKLKNIKIDSRIDFRILDTKIINL